MKRSLGLILPIIALIAFITACQPIPGAQSPTLAPRSPSPGATIGKAQPTLLTIAPPTQQSKEVTCPIGPVHDVLSTPGGLESVAVAKDGTVYTADNCSGEVYRIQPDGAHSVLATIPFGVDNSKCDAAGTLGVEVSDDGDIWVVVFSQLPASHGVWRVGLDGSTELAFPMPPAGAPIPNDLVFDTQGNLYITESTTGAVWKAPSNGVAETWLRTNLLAPPAGQQLGANGIAFRDDALYVSNFGGRAIVMVPIESDGSAGTPVVFATIRENRPGLIGPDALEFDAHGNLYTVTAQGAQLIRITPSGDPEVVLDLRAPRVSFPTGIALGLTEGEINTAYIANLNPAPGESTLVKVGLCAKD